VTPTARTLQHLKKLGYTAQVVEQTIRGKGMVFKRDLFGCIDIIAVGVEAGCLGVQACAAGSHAARLTKAKEQPGLADWLRCGNRFEVWSWAKHGPRGKRKVWTLRREDVNMQDLCLTMCMDALP
jgi:hypothetical protein